MEGVTHPMFRALMIEQGGLGMVCTEFVRITQDAPRAAAIARCVVKQGGVPLSVQVMGNHVSHMADAAAKVMSAGADVVDINLGCPMPRVVKKGVGSAMLKDPALLEDVVSAMRSATPGLLSAKMRAGVDSNEHAIKIAQLLERCGVDFLAVHPRRQTDGYSGVADWKIVSAIADALHIPVIGNGDLWYAAAAVDLLERTPIAAVMIGRPALRNPWLFRQIAALLEGQATDRPTGEDVVAFLDGVRLRYGAADRLTLGRMKEILRYLARVVPDPLFRRDVLREQSLDAVMSFCETRLARLPAEALDLDAHGTLSLERVPAL